MARRVSWVVGVVVAVLLGALFAGPAVGQTAPARLGAAGQDAAPRANQPPTAQFIYTVNGLRLYVNGNVSTDADGRIVSYSWDYGDGTAATGAVPPIKTYAKSGSFTVKLTAKDDAGASASFSRIIKVTGGATTAVEPGAQLPVIYNLSELKGTKRFVAPNGSNTTGDGSQGKPYQTLQKAVDAAKAGDSIVVRGGTYAIAKTTIGKADVTVTAYPGETPVFDGSAAAPSSATTEGALKWFTYQPVPAKAGEGLNISQLPEAKFDSAGNPTGLAAERGWMCVASSGSYARTTTDPEAGQEIPYDSPRFRVGSGCGAGTTPRMIAGLYPDQVWVNGKRLIQVLDKSKVKTGYFYVPRSSANDANPPAGKLYLSSQDAADMSKVRVSKSSDNFLIVQGKGVTLRGLRVANHSPAWPFFALTVTSNVDNFTAQDMEFSSVASVATKVAGGDSAGGAGISDNPKMQRVTISDAGWIGTSQLYTTGGVVADTRITGSNRDREFVTAPKSGGIKATKTHGMTVVRSDISNNNGHGIWWDQSNYNATLADSSLNGNSDSAIFYEISHGLTMVNNIITRSGSPSSSPTVRLAGASSVLVVNNTIVGGQVPLALAGDPRSKSYGPNNRLCSEHTERYRQGGNVASDCPPALSSDLDKARAGQYGNPNLTPGMNWRPSGVLVVNNILANPVAGSGGICPGGYALCIKGYAGSSSRPEVTLPTNQILPKSIVMNGNLYQSANTVAEVLTASGQAGGFISRTLPELKGSNGFGSGHYGLAVDANGLQGTDYVTADGKETPKLASAHSKAAPVPTNAVVNKYLAAGTRHYGAVRKGNTGEVPAALPKASFTANVQGSTVSVDGSGSTFTDGSVAGYLWDFGDDTGIEVGRTAQHVYSAPGTYDVTLVAIGSNASFGYATRTVVVSDPRAPSIASDTFTRLVPQGWGTADVGGPWTLLGSPAKYFVDGDRGAFVLDPGKSLRAVLDATKTTSSEVSVIAGTGQTLTGGGVYISALPRVMADGSAYRAKVNIKADGTASLALTRVDAAGKETVLKSSATTLTGVKPGTPIRIKVQADGTSPTKLMAKAWKDTDAEPVAWQAEVSDSGAGLQAAGGTGLFGYESSSSTGPVQWFFGDYLVVKPGTTPVLPPPPPTPGPTPTPTPTPRTVAEDLFNRSATSSWGKAGTGGTWVLQGSAAKFSVNGQRGQFTLDPGKGLRAMLTQATSSAADLTVRTGPAQAVTGGGVHVSAVPRILADGTAYRAKVQVKADGTTSLALTRVDAAGNETVLATAPSSAGLTGIKAGTLLRIRVQAVGTSPTTLRARVWADGAVQPSAWQVTVTDSTKALQVAAGSGLFAYESSSATKAVVLQFEDYRVRQIP